MTLFDNTPNQEESLYDHLAPESDTFTLRLEDIAGLEAVKTTLQQTVIPTLQTGAPGIVAPIVVLHGPSGAGKQRVAQAVAGELHDRDFTGLHLTPNVIMDVTPHNASLPEHQLAALVDQLRDDAPVVLVIEHPEVSHIDDAGPLSRVVDRIRQHGDRVACVIVVDSPPSRRPSNSLFTIADFSLQIPPPGPIRRARLLEHAVTSVTNDTGFELDSQIQFEELAPLIEGFDREEYDDIGRRAAQLALGPDDTPATITHTDLETAISQVDDERHGPHSEPSNGHLGTTVAAKFAPAEPDVRFGDIGGLDEQIARVREILTFPDTFPEVYESAGLDTGHGLLFHGPPGTGKTLLAKAIATESDRTFYAVKGPEVKNKYYGETERRLRGLFEAAGDMAPSLLFFDEFDALAGDRNQQHSVLESTVNTLLTELDGLDDRTGILVVAATNRRAVLDEAVLRPGRIDEQLECPPPDRAGRKDIFAIHSDGLPCAADVTAEWFADAVQSGVTGAKIESICKRAAHLAMRKVQRGTRSTVRISRTEITEAIETILDNDYGDSHDRGFL